MFDIHQIEEVKRTIVCNFALYLLKKYENPDSATVDEIAKFSKEIEKAQMSRSNGFTLIPIVGKYTRNLKGFTGIPI